MPQSNTQKVRKWAGEYGPGESKVRELVQRGCPFQKGDEAVLEWIATRPVGLSNAMASRMRQAIHKRNPPKPIDVDKVPESESSGGNSYADTVEDQGRLVRYLTQHLKQEMDAGILPSQEIFDMRDKAIHRQRELARDEMKIREAGENLIEKSEAVDAVSRVVSLYDDSWDQAGYKLLDRMRGEPYEKIPEVFEELRLEVATRINNEIKGWSES